jgi:hypothetical protein
MSKRNKYKKVYGHCSESGNKQIAYGFYSCSGMKDRFESDASDNLSLSGASKFVRSYSGSESLSTSMCK